MLDPQNNPQEEENILENKTEETASESHIPPVAKKVSRFGMGQFQQGSKFSKNATHFNPPNKQRVGRSAGRGR